MWVTDGGLVVAFVVGLIVGYMMAMHFQEESIVEELRKDGQTDISRNRRIVGRVEPRK